MTKRKILYLPVFLSAFIFLCAFSANAEERPAFGGGSPVSIPASVSVSVYGHVMASEGEDRVYYMIEAEEQMCPLTSLQVTFTRDERHSVWCARTGGEQMNLGVFGAGTHRLPLPVDVKEVGMLIHGGEVDGLNLCIPDAQANVSAYTGSYLSILGDSLSSVELAGSLQSDVEGLNVASKWWYIAARELGMNILVNGAVGSTGIGVDVPEGAENSGLHKCTGLHTKDHEPDCIFVLLGMNDLFTGKDIEEVEREYRQMLDQTRARYPKAGIVLFTYPHIGDGTEGDINALLALYVAQMNDVVYRVAGDYGLPVVDLYGCGITADNIGDYVRKPGDIHPNRAGQALMGRAAIRGLREAAGSVQ